MPTFERSIEIAASPEAVWSIVEDASLVPKIFPDVISATIDPPGKAHVGQRITITMRMAGRKLQATTETTEVVPNKKIVFKQLPGGPFKTLVNTTILQPSKRGTMLTAKSEYEASAGYLGKALSVLLVNRMTKNNLQASVTNIKKLAELKELPSSTTK